MFDVKHRKMYLTRFLLVVNYVVRAGNKMRNKYLPVDNTTNQQRIFCFNYLIKKVNTCRGLCYISCGILAEIRNCSTDPVIRISTSNNHKQ